jgi:hypothetical protein
MDKKRSSSIVSGITLIVIGLLLFWLDRSDFIGGELIFFILGSVFLGAYLFGKKYGLLIPGCLLLGLGVGKTLGSMDLIDKPVMIGLGFGFIGIYLIALLYEKKSHWWPLIPGGVMLAQAFSSAEAVVRFVFDNWPLVLVVIGIFILLGTFRQKGSSKADS